MATTSEIQSLDTIGYKSRIHTFFWILFLFVLFLVAFLNYFPISDKVRDLMNSRLKGSACAPEFSHLRMEWLLPKIVVSDVTVPSACFGRDGQPLKMSFVTLNWNLISFAPFGLPFRLDTELSGQPISLHFVQGLGVQNVRLIDQPLNLEKLRPILGEKFKMGGNVVVDLSMQMSKGSIKELYLKAASKNFQLPPQNIEGFTTPNLTVNDFFLEANSDAAPRLNVDRLTIGDPDAPIRANFKGRVDMVDGNLGMSPLNLNGEVAFSKNLIDQLPLIDMVFQAFPQKDGFYQVRIGGTLGAPKPSAP